MNTTTEAIVNGIDTAALWGAAEAITADASKGVTKWEVTSHWRGGTRSDAQVSAYEIGGARIAKNFTISADEPLELCGTNKFANPQELLMAALNACMIVGYAANCAMQGIILEELRIEMEGNIDLRGFLGISPEVPPGYDELRYTVHIKGNGTPEQFEQIHRTVMQSSPNYYNVRNAIPLKSRLVVE